MRVERPGTGRRTAQVAAQHEVKNEEAVFIVLESVPQVDDERVVDLRVVHNVSGDGQLTERARRGGGRVPPFEELDEENGGWEEHFEGVEKETG